MFGRATRIGFIVATLVVVNGCGVLDSCDERAAVERVKRLDQAYLAQLYAYAESGECKRKCTPPILNRLAGIGNRPPVFEALPDGQARIKLSVCVEYGVELRLKDIGTPHAAIYVTWSVDFPKWDQVLLWSAGQPVHET
jgi:hypothetical protein